MTEKEILKEIQEFMFGHMQCAVATYGEHPWIATVYYAVDDEMNIYFLSNPETIHGKAISQNPNVSVVIADSPQLPGAEKKGLALYGLCEEIKGQEGAAEAITLWKKALNVTSDAYSYEGMMSKAIKGRMYKISPKKVKFFNEELWEEGQEPLIQLQ